MSEISSRVLIVKAPELNKKYRYLGVLPGQLLVGVPKGNIDANPTMRWCLVGLIDNKDLSLVACAIPDGDQVNFKEGDMVYLGDNGLVKS